MVVASCSTKPLTAKHYYTNVNGGCWERTWKGFHYTDTIYKGCKCKDVLNKIEKN